MDSAHQYVRHSLCTIESRARANDPTRANDDLFVMSPATAKCSLEFTVAGSGM